MGDFKQLTVWQRARTLATMVYRNTSHFPPREDLSLTAQMRRSATSIASNIAESTGRWSDADQRRFLYVAQGSARELESHLLVAQDLGFLKGSAFDEPARTLDEVQRMLSALIRYKRG